MKRLIIGIMAILAISLLLMGVGCDLEPGPQGEVGPAGPEGLSGPGLESWSHIIDVSEVIDHITYHRVTIYDERIGVGDWIDVWWMNEAGYIYREPSFLDAEIERWMFTIHLGTGFLFFNTYENPVGQELVIFHVSAIMEGVE